jgi:hypothetical protein
MAVIAGSAVGSPCQADQHGQDGQRDVNHGQIIHRAPTREREATGDKIPLRPHKRMTPPSKRDPPDDLDSRLEQVFAAPLDRFVAERNALAADLKRAGRAADSARVKGLGRPSLPAWAVNQVYWHARADYDRLTASGDRMRDLQRRALSGRDVDLQEATRDRQQAIRTFVDRAAALMRDAGQTVTDATRQRIGVTADAIAAYGSRPHEYQPGRLERDLDPPGFAALAGLASGGSALRLVKSAGSLRSEEAAPRRRSSSATHEPATAQRDREAVRHRREALKDATRTRDAKKRELDRVRQSEASESERLKDVQQELAPLRQRVALLEARAQKAEEALAAARSRTQDVEREWKAAAERVSALEASDNDGD